MAKIVIKDIYHDLGAKIDNLAIRTPMNQSFYDMLKELYTEEEADLIVKMPYNLSTIDRLVRVTKIDKPKLLGMLDVLCKKGLVFDMMIGDEYKYMVNPLLPGIYEFPVMNIKENLDQKSISQYMEEYFNYEPFWKVNFNRDNRISIMRTLPYGEAVEESHFTEILDYERIEEIIEDNDVFATSLCACRHKRLQVHGTQCDAPLDNCTTFGVAAEHFIRHDISKQISREEMRENVARSREMKLILNTDHVKNQPGFLCHCCKCCCVPLNKIRTRGVENLIITSTVLAEVNDNCVNCKRCITGCPIDAISVTTVSGKESIEVDSNICLGCGVCSLHCNKNGITLKKRHHEVITPSHIVEKVCLQSLERGTFQNLIFDNPQSLSHKFLRSFVGVFLRLPSVKRGLINKILKSNFLDRMVKP